jgi:hypothetical protein
MIDPERICIACGRRCARLHPFRQQAERIGRAPTSVMMDAAATFPRSDRKRFMPLHGRRKKKALAIAEIDRDLGRREKLLTIGFGSSLQAFNKVLNGIAPWR